MSTFQNIRGVLEEQTRIAFCTFMQSADNLITFGRGIRDAHNYYGHSETTAVSAFASMVGLSCGIRETPLPEPQQPIGQCSTSYCIYVRVRGTTSSGPFDNGDYTLGGALCSYEGPFSEPYVSSQGTGFPHVFVNDALGTPIRFLNVNGVDIESMEPQHRRVDGEPDNCGEPTYGEIAVPSREDREIVERQFEYPDGAQDSAGWRFNIPFVGVGGAIIAPFEFFKDGNLFGKIDLSTGEITFDFGGDSSEEQGQGSAGGDNPSEPEEEDEDKREIVGAVVEVVSINEKANITRIEQLDNPDVLVPDAGLISFRIVVNKTDSYWSVDQKVKSAKMYIPAPEGVKAIEVKGTPRPGVEFIISEVHKVVQPIKRK